MTILMALVLGTGIGILLGLLGGGGSILAVPGLVFGLGMPLAQAVPMSLLVVGIAALFGSIGRVRKRQVQWRVAAIFAATGLPAAFVGSVVNRLLPPAVTLAGFAVLMVVSGVRMLSKSEGSGVACRTEGSTVDWRRCAARAVPIGLGVGFLTGLFGVGGGFLIIPALVLLLGLDMVAAIGTSLIIVVANSASGMLAYLGGLSLDWRLVTAFTSAAILGSLAAGRVGTTIDTRRLRTWFAYLVFAVAAFVLAEVLFLH
ncbi:sulfite exporter TauE/SafE family protein [Nocardia otitidiscaviarum]|uniref:sulfite exporter TauE/SafE family protein n=1 Tax=Nocardia otitidiscaviarum TaxID=1823 RepID=UPI0004A75012|nr:sulfite exporter TauE/SafE family protein [Nocardia otitidiscaviarum]MBF6134742.1 sulfite exporter TauE/SafE family protein [Nocardia otitidiscaviarum]MBF6485632.1 sulfite exporter TauE/SafE family protein [Nocardia otitidiscaviarum]